MSMNKQTAVDYLDEAIDKYLAYCVEGSHKGEPFKLEKLYAAVQQAKAMHKQEIVEAWENGNHKEMRGGKYLKAFSSKYYNETFGGNNGE